MLQPSGGSALCRQAARLRGRGRRGAGFALRWTPTAPKRQLFGFAGSKELTHAETRVLPYTQRELFNIIADVDSYSTFVPFASSSGVLSALRTRGGSSQRPTKEDPKQQGWLARAAAEDEGEKWDMDATLRVGAMGFEESYVSQVRAIKCREVTAVAKHSDLFRHLTAKWTLQPLAAGKTKVDLNLSCEFKSPLHAIAVTGVWDKVTRLIGGEFEKRVKSVYGTR